MISSPYDLYFGKLENGEYRGLSSSTCNVCGVTLTKTWGNEKERHILFHESIRPWAMDEEVVKAEIEGRGYGKD